MSTSVTFNGSTYSVPATGDTSWGDNVSNYLIAIASGCLQKSGGTFTLTAEIDFGATYGVKTAYLKSRATNPSSTGIVRLGNTESVKWRNAANNADLDLTVNASNALQFNSVNVMTGTASPTEIGYLVGVTSLIQTQLDAKIPKTLTTTTGDIIYASSANTPARLAIGSASQVLTVSGGLPVWATPIAAVQTTKGDLAGYDTAPNRLPVGTNGQYLKSDSTQAIGLKWQSFITPTVQKFTSGSGTYTTPANVLYINVRMIGGGGGGGGSGTSSGNGGAGGNTTFGTTLLVANGGTGGNGATGGLSGGTGGTASLGTGPIGSNFTGSGGGGGGNAASSTGGIGGTGIFGMGAGVGGIGSGTSGGTGGTAVPNTGAGGGGSGSGSTAVNSGGGGGSGGYLDAIISSPSATYSYAIGNGGSAGSAGTSGSAGGVGGQGFIEVIEYYN